ncbi:RNA helicase [Mediannikoviicoccus vaginalis]|uniref:RNA helicase n=1 Tax=Mediannikoviicoccus vaginalis TaxID=2899727 RepID=UPI001F314703|nr:RNA helicase [Mediannikoviicoccus vaginalis]
MVDHDEYIQNLNDEISDLYSSYYKIDCNDEPVYFDKEQEKKDKYKMLDLLGKLMKRFYEVNDGSFEIDDRETERVKNL